MQRSRATLCGVARPDLNSSAWRKVRLDVLNRDRWVCRVRLPGCRLRATDAHHLDDYAVHGGSLDPERLVASCGHCNKVLGGRLARRLQLQRRASRSW